MKSSLTVLVCEDDAIIRMDTVDMLSDLGHVVLEAENGERALAIASERDVDVLLTDVGLPDLSGVELARRIRETRPSLAIVFATGHDGVDGFDEAPRTAILQKPYRSHTLEKILQSVTA